MNRCASMINNERGATMLVALLTMALLAIIGISALDLTDSEYQMVTNDRYSTKAFYHAESAGKEVVNLLENLASTDPDSLRDFTPAWLGEDDLDRSDISQWITTDPDPANVNAAQSTVALDGNANYSVVYRGVASGASKDVSKSRLYEYEAYGNYIGSSPRDNSVSIVEIGYRVRF